MAIRVKLGSIQAAMAVVAFVAAASMGVQSVSAQTMGEYGMATGHAAASASGMRSIEAAPPSITSSASSRDNSTHTEEIRGYGDEAPSANDQGRKDDESNDSNNSSQDWVQLK